MICGAAGDVFQHLGGFCIINPIFSAQRESDGIQVHAQTTETGDVVLAIQSKAGFGVEMIADNYRKMYMVCGQNWAALLASPGRKQQNNFSAVGGGPTALIPAELVRMIQGFAMLLHSFIFDKSSSLLFSRKKLQYTKKEALIRDDT